MTITPYNSLFKLVKPKKRVKLSSPNNIYYRLQTPRQREKRDFGRSGLVYTTCELLTIDDTFNYYSSELIGDPFYDLPIIYGEKDTHNSVGILTRPAEENIAKIKRNHDISLFLCDDTYVINNGRHRLVYLQHYYKECAKYCDTEESLQSLKEQVTIPVRITKRIEDKEINDILLTLKDRYENISIYKSNILNDNLEIVITYNNSLFYLKNKTEIIDFFIRLELDDNTDIYKIMDINPNPYPDIEKIYAYLYSKVGQDLYTFSYITLIRYLMISPPTIDNQLITIDQIPLRKLYLKYLEMINCYMTCQTYDTDLPYGTDYSYSTHSKERKIGAYLMEIINNHPEYKYLKWPEIFEILHEDSKLKQYDNEYLKDISIEHGIRLVLGEQIFTKKLK